MVDLLAWCLTASAALRRAQPDATVTVGLASVLVAFEAPPVDHAATFAAIAVVVAGIGDDGLAVPPAARRHVLPAAYDGPDLAEVAGVLGLPAATVVARHQAATWTVAAIGFSPGFGYLVAEDPLFAAVPRRTDPRRRVPGGSIALAAGMCAVYPDPTPGGWQLIGRCPTPLFDVAADPPALLAVGDEVRFVEVR